MLTAEQKERANLAASDRARRDKLAAEVLTYKKGQYLKIHFDKHLFIPDSYDEAQKTARLTTQEKDIAADRAYADKLKETLYNDLVSKKITFAEAMDIVRKDKYIDYSNESAWGATLGDPGVSFDTLNAPAQSNLLENPEYREHLLATGAGEVSEPFVTRLDYGDWKKGEEKMVDSLWVIMKVDSENKGEATNFDSWLETKIREAGVKKLKENYNYFDLFTGRVYALKYFPKDLMARTAYAWSNSYCTAGRANDGSSHPGDLITDARKILANGDNIAHPNAYSYVNHQKSTAYAYSGCPLTSGYTLNNVSGWEASENSQANGCMYKFSSVYTGTTFNLCCSGDHNPHIWAVGNADTNKEQWGHWHMHYSGSTDGSGWSGPYTSNFHAGYGATYSAFDMTSGTDGDYGPPVSIINGDTIYKRAYWHVDPSYNLVVTKSGTGTGTVTSPEGGISCGTNCGENYVLDDAAPDTTLTATPAAGSYFSGWSDSYCAKDGTRPCTVNMDRNRTVTAYFNLNPTSTTLNVVINPPAAATAQIDGVTQSSKSYNTSSSAQTGTAGYTNINAAYAFTGWGVGCPTVTFPSRSTTPATCTANFGLIGTPSCSLGAPGQYTTFTTPSAGGSTSVNMTATSTTNGLNASMAISYQRAGASSWNQFTPASTGVNPSQSGTANNLTAGTYYFSCGVTDSASRSYTSPARTFYVNDPSITTFTFTVEIIPSIAATPTGGGTYSSGTSVTAGFSGVNSLYRSTPTWSSRTSASCPGPISLTENEVCIATFDVIPVGTPLSCSINPTGGDLPLVVTISASGGTAPYSYYDNGASVPGSSSSINRTITDTIAHVYTIRDSAGVTAPPCSTVTANSNSDGTGNEVAP